MIDWVGIGFFVLFFALFVGGAIVVVHLEGRTDLNPYDKIGLQGIAGFFSAVGFMFWFLIMLTWLGVGWY